MSAQPARGRAWWWIRFVAIQGVLVAGLLEIALRIYNPIGWRVRGNEIVLPVKHVYTFDNGASVRKIDRVTTHTKNSLGFRGPDPPREFDARLTVVTVGGSTTESLYISDGRTWTDAMARALEPRFPTLWVNNAGLDGHSTFGHLVLLDAVISRLKPKVAVFLMGINDVGLDAANTFDAGVYVSAGGWQRVATAAARHSELANTGLNLARAMRARQRGLGHSELDLSTVDELVLNDDAMERTVEQYRAALPAYAARLTQLAVRARNAGIQPVWVTQPALYGDLRDPTTGVDLSRAKVNGRGNGHLEWRLLELYNDETRRLGDALDVPVIDLARLLPKDSRYFYDFLHFTNEGSERVGALVAEGLRPLLERVASAERAARD